MLIYGSKGKPKRAGVTIRAVGTALLAVMALSLSVPSALGGETPVCRIVAISNPMVTALPKKKLPANRKYFAQSIPEGMSAAIEAIDKFSPDAVLILGQLTLTDSDADRDVLNAYLARISAPVYLVPDRSASTENDEAKDVAAGLAERFSEHRTITPPAAIDVNSVHLQFVLEKARVSGAILKERIDWMEKDFASTRDAAALLSFVSPELEEDVRRFSPHERRRLFEMAVRHKVAAQLVASTWGHSLGYYESVATWGIPCSARTGPWCAALVTVYTNRVDLSLIKKTHPQPLQTLTVPNPVSAARMPTALEAPFGLPPYNEDLALKPQHTFVQISDPQFDDATALPEGKNFTVGKDISPVLVERINRLKPDFVFITGDLTHKNSPSEWLLFASIYSRLETTLYPLPGNHDAVFTFDGFVDGYDFYAKQERFEPTKARVLKATRNCNEEGFPGPLGQFKKHTGRERNYTVTRGGTVFICLGILTQAVDEEQLKWIEAELERSKDARHVIVLGHYPLLDVLGRNVRGQLGGDKLLALFKEHNVAAYLSGHRHKYDYHMHDGTMHVSANAATGRAELSYQIYHVFPDRIVSCWRPFDWTSDVPVPLYERVMFPEPRFREDGTKGQKKTESLTAE